MPSIRKLFSAAALALALTAVAHDAAHAQPQAAAARWRGNSNEQLIDQAIRRYGYRPSRLTDPQVRAINNAWTELLGSTTRRVTLNRTQATAIVYMALVYPYEDQRTRPDGSYPGGGYDRPDDGYDRPGDGYGGRPGSWGAQCDQLQSDAYRLGTLISAPEINTGLFVAEPERGRARSLARQIQQRAVDCRATEAADRAGEVMILLAEALPERQAVSRRVDALKEAIRRAAPDRPRR